MIRFLSLLTVFFIALTSQAQNSEQAKKMLDEVSTKIKSYQNIAIDFTYQTGSHEGKGKATIQGEKYIVDFMGVTQLFDGNKTYIINPNDEEITISSSQDNHAVSIAGLLTFYTQGYSYVWDTTQKVGNKTIQYIKLIPNKSSDVKEIYLGIDTQTNHIYNRTDVYKNGSKVVITVNSFKTNQALSKNHFTFTTSKYPNYYINNLD